jgi:hypothetical protein
VLKNAIDYLYAEWNNKAVGLVSYGASVEPALSNTSDSSPESYRRPTSDRAIIGRSGPPSAGPHNRRVDDQKCDAVQLVLARCWPSASHWMTSSLSIGPVMINNPAAISSWPLRVPGEAYHHPACSPAHSARNLAASGTASDNARSSAAWRRPRWTRGLPTHSLVRTSSCATPGDEEETVALRSRVLVDLPKPVGGPRSSRSATRRRLAGPLRQRTQAAGTRCFRRPSLNPLLIMVAVHRPGRLPAEGRGTRNQQAIVMASTGLATRCPRLQPCARLGRAVRRCSPVSPPA